MSTEPCCIMAQHQFQLYCRRVNAAQNMARYYRLSMQLSLFGTFTVTRAWGRIGAGGQEKIHHFASDHEAICFFLKLARQKRARGYQPIASV